MSANFTPVFGGYREPGAFRFWCQKVLPLVYDDSLSYYELLCKVVDYINNLIHDNSETIDNMEALLTAYNQLQDYVNNYFANLDLTGEVSNKIDEMAEDGDLLAIIQPTLDAMGQYLVDQSAAQQEYNEETRADVTTSIASQTAYNTQTRTDMNTAIEQQNAYNTQTRTQVGASINEQNAYNAQTRGMLSAAYNAPIPVTSTDMIPNGDNIVVWIGTTAGNWENGHWYFVSKSGGSIIATIDGGVYQATAVELDKSLNIPDIAADAGSVGVRLRQFAPRQSWTSNYRLNPSTGAAESYTGQSTEHAITGFIDCTDISDILGFDYTSGLGEIVTCGVFIYDENSTYLGYIFNSAQYGYVSTSGTMSQLSSAPAFQKIRFDVNITTYTAEQFPYSYQDIMTVRRIGTDKSLKATNVPADSGVVGKEITQLNDDIGNITLGWVSGKFIYYETGTEGSSGTYSHTDYIPCAGIGLSVKTEVTSTSAGIAFYDSDKQYVSGFSPYSDNYTLFNLVIPDNATYVRISCLDRYLSNFILKRYGSINKISATLGELKDEVATQGSKISRLEQIASKSKNLLPINGNSVSINAVSAAYNDGEVTFSGTASGSGGRLIKLIQPITLSAGTYTVSVFDPVTDMYIENTSDTVIATVMSNNAWSASFTLAEETSVYLGANVASGSSYSGTCKVILESGSKTAFVKPSCTTAIDDVARTALTALNSFWSYAIGKTLCIGDSLTSGACYTGSWNGASIDQNYPRYLGMMLDTDVTNGGVSGLTASQWYTNEISKYTLTDYDTFIIWLGTNGGLTDTLDTDVNPYTDYNDYANTNTGNYCKIIGKILAENPDSLIILTKVFVSDTTNTVIDKIATKYGLAVVDNSDLTVANYPALHGNINNVHFTKAGNLFIANRFVTIMGDIFANNPAMTNYGLTARTN